MNRLTLSLRQRSTGKFFQLKLHRILSIASLLWCSVMCIGCGEAPVTGAATSDGADMVAPQQTQLALQQLRSPRAQEQLSGLLFLERFPSLAQSQLEQISVLANTGASATVKKKATELLTKLPTDGVPTSP